MSQILGPRVKILRSLGVDLPGLTVKSQERRPYPPGEHGHKRRKLTEYGLRVQETKKIRFNYCVSEKYLRRLVEESQRSRAVATHKLIELFERRLDNVIFRAGFAQTIPAARQIVTHGHILLNGKRLDIPSFRVSPGDEFSFKKVERPISDARFDIPTWLKVERDARTVAIVELPNGEETPFMLDVKLIIEHYSTRL